jgi:hypothetical protein
MISPIHVMALETVTFPDSAAHMWSGTVIQYDDTPCNHVGMLSLVGNTKVSKNSTMMLCIDGDVRFLECQYQQSNGVKKTVSMTFPTDG